jgi:hypothetical protein
MLKIMATYKVIQDIEAEDKLIWLFSFRQFVYLLIAFFFSYISFLFITIHGWFLDLLTVPFVIFFGILAYPLGKDQPTEVWVLAKIRFFLVPRKRVWTQTGTKNLVTITAPKKIVEIKTNSLDQNQIKSRLQALANTLDTRGWVIKQNSFTNYSSMLNSTNNDRLLIAEPIENQVEDFSTINDDILNTEQNPLAQKMVDLISINEQEHRKKIMSNLEKIREKTEPLNAPPIIQPTAISTSTDMSRVRANRVTKAKQPSQKTEERVSTKQLNPAILNLSGNNDYSVTVISHEADKISKKENNEVSINLH